MSAVLLGLGRALPLTLCLPLPGLVPRLALALLLASSAPVAAGAGAWPVDLFIGIAIGLVVGAPLWAARLAGKLVSGTLASRAPVDTVGLALGALAWVVFSAQGGLSTLLAAFLGSYTHWPMATGTDALVRVGGELLALGARLALPALLAVGALELAGAALARFEETAALDFGGARLARGARPLVAMLLVVASLAALSTGVASATRDLGAAVDR